MKGVLIAVLILATTLRAESATAMLPSTNGVTASFWIYNEAEKRMVESRFVVDFDSNTESPQQIPNSGVPTLPAARARLNAEAYERLVNRFHEATQAERTTDLVTAMDKLRQGSSAGATPQAAILASPNGRYVIVRPRFANPLVVDLRTLEAHRLMDDTGLEPTPMAWSPDSKLVAFSASTDRPTISIYDVEHALINKTLPSKSLWVQALAWSPDTKQLAVLAFGNRRLHKTPAGLLEAFSGHPDFRNDLVVERIDLSGGTKSPVTLKTNISEQNTIEFSINWNTSKGIGTATPADSIPLSQ